MATSHLFIEAELDEVSQCDNEVGTLVFYSNKNPLSTEEQANEDAALFLDSESGALLLAVSDGCGGHRSGQIAAKLSLECLHENTKASLQTSNDSRVGIINGFECATKKVQALGVGAMCTLAAVEVRDNTVRCFHVGDTSILTCSSRARIKYQSLAHSPVGYGVESGLLTPREAFEHEDRHIVSNLVGLDSMHIELGSPFVLAKQDTLIISSDGLFDNIRAEAVAKIICKGNLKKAAQLLVKTAQQNMASDTGHPDDLTFFAFRRK